ncbi:MAG: type II toxin-antitoxin system RatA family toxin [Pseudomonadota bacterium]
MKHVNKSVLLWYSAREMFDLVADVEAYPQFLPWCQRAEVLVREPEAVTARLHLIYAGVKQTFTTRNVHDPGRSMTVSLVDGPFSKLEGLWRFIPLQSPGSDAPSSACKVEFDLKYEFSQRAFELVLSPMFERVANTFVEAFVKRAEAVHGAR